MHTTYYLGSAQDVNTDLLDSIKAAFKSKSITITVRESDCDPELTDEMKAKYGEDKIELEMKDQYYNMIEKVKEKFESVEIAEQALKDLGITPNIKPIRGGTDGSRLSFMGLPCPNIFAGGHNFHGPYEYVPLESMEKATQVIIRIGEIVAGE